MYLDEAKPGGDAGPPRRVPGAVPGPYDPRDELIATLKEQLEAERNAHAETRRITYTLARRPELEPPRDERHVPETDAETGEGTDASTGQVAREKPSSRPRSWWQKVFGLE